MLNFLCQSRVQFNGYAIPPRKRVLNEHLPAFDVVTHETLLKREAVPERSPSLRLSPFLLQL